MNAPITPVRRSLLRRIAWLGADRRLVGMAGLIGVILGWTMFVGFGLLYGLSVGVPAVFFGAIVWVGRDMNSNDPWMIDVLNRHLKYRKYYAPRPHLAMKPVAMRDFH